MAKSPFRNFDLEKIQHDDPKAAFAKAEIGTYAVSRLLLHCAITCRESERPLDNDRYAAIVDQIPQYEAEQPTRQVEYGDYLPITPCPPIRGISHAQFRAGRALVLVDEVLDIVAAQGWCAAAADRLLLAAEWESDARNNQVDTVHQITFQKLAEQRGALIAEGVKRKKSDDGRRAMRLAKQKKGTAAWGRERQKKFALRLFKKWIDKRCAKAQADGKTFQVTRGCAAEAAKEITPKVQDYQAKKKMHPLTDENAELTIYKHFLNCIPKAAKRYKKS